MIIIQCNGAAPPNGFCEQVKDKGIPVVALVESGDDLRKQLYDQGVVDCIFTPVIAQELLFRISSTVNAFKCGCLYNDSTVVGEVSAATATQSVQSGDSDVALIQQTCRYLTANLNTKLMLDDIALSMGSNRSSLAAMFKQVMGQSVFEWLRRRRMLKAKSLLLNSTMSIQQIAFEVGYEYCGNFSITYKKQFNISPRQQRKLHT